MSTSTHRHRAVIVGPGDALGKVSYALWHGDCRKLLRELPKHRQFDLVLTSPPYNLGKEYESKSSMDKYLALQEAVIDAVVPRLKRTGSLCWQVGNYVQNENHWISCCILFSRSMVWYFAIDLCGASGMASIAGGVSAVDMRLFYGTRRRMTMYSTWMPFAYPASTLANEQQKGAIQEIHEERTQRMSGTFPTS